MHALGKVLAAGDPFDDRWYTSSQRYGSAEMPVTEDDAMTIPAFYAAVTYVAEDVGKVPLNMFEDVPLDERRSSTRRARGHELQELLHDQPNRRQTSIMWREMVTAIAMLRGRTVNEQIYGPATSFPGRPTRQGSLQELVPLHPDLLRRELIKDSGDWKYIYADPRQDFKERKLLSEDVFVVSGRQDRSVLDFAARNLATEIAMEQHTGFMFSRGAKHSGVIKAKGKLAAPVRTALRRGLDEYAVGGPRAGRPLLLEDGMEWQDISMAPRDTELLAQRQFSVAQVCRWIRVPPHKVYDLTRSTNNNIGVQGVDYVVDSLLGWCERWEQAIWRDLIVDKAFFAKHNLDGLLRGDPEARARMYALAIMWGWMSRNEVREREDLNPIDGLDEPLTPGNMTVGADGVPRAMPKNSQQAGGGQAQLAAGGRLDAGLLRLFAADAAAAVIRRECAAMTKLAERVGSDQAAWQSGVRAFYADHPALVVDRLHVPEHEAVRHARSQRDALLAHGPSAMGDWMTERVADLAGIAAELAGEQVSAPGASRPLRVEVHSPAIHIPAPNVTVPVTIAEGAVQVRSETPVTIERGAVSAPVTIAAGAVAVAPPQLTVMQTGGSTRRVERDEAGRIARVVEE